MQCAVVEFARNVAKLDAASQEVKADVEHPVIHLMEDQQDVVEKGGTMRLGSYTCALEKDSKAYKAYGKKSISERHRHRYEFNNDYLEVLAKNGMRATGVNPETNLVEIVEITDHPWFVGVQFHPELKSTVEAPHKMFVSFVKAALEHKINK
jgi:CTP synthase